MILDTAPILKSLWRSKVGPLLIIAQLALSIAIISNAVFFLQGRVDKIQRETGADSQALAQVWVKERPGELLRQEIIGRDLENLRALSGVRNAAAIGQSVPFSHSGGSSGFSRLPEGDPKRVSKPAATMPADHAAVATLGLTLVEGRSFFPEEIDYYPRNQRPGTASAIITESLAEFLFEGQSPVGQTVFLAGAVPLTVVGVVEDFLGYFPATDFAYDNVLISAIELSEKVNYVVQGEDPAGLLPRVRQALQNTDARRIVKDERTMASMIRVHYSDDYAMVILLLLVMVLLVFVNTLGVVGITTFWVNQRRRQVGIRRALGATRLAILRYFLVENVILVTLATFVGACLALMAGHYFTAHHAMAALPWWYAPFAGGVMLIMTQAAAWWPSQRAARVPAREAIAG